MAGQQVDILPQEFTLEQERFNKTQEVGRGAYGVVWIYVSQTPGRNALPWRLAAKCDISGNSTISKETYFMAKMMKAGLQTVPKYFGERYNLGKSYIIMQLVEYSVDEYLIQFQNVDGRLNLPQICEHMLRALQSLHEINLVHQDVKPDNFRISEDNKVYIFDFGLVSDYVPNGRHKPMGKFGFQGSPYFASVSALNGYTLSRRDDIESLGYTIMSLLSNDQVPWKDLPSQRDIKAAKEKFLQAPSATIPEIFIGIRQFIIRARSLGYEEDPDYNAFRHDLRCMMKPLLEDKAEKAVQLLIERHGLEIARSQYQIAKVPVVERLAQHYSNFNRVVDTTLRSFISNFGMNAIKFAHHERQVEKAIESYCESLLDSYHNKQNPEIIQLAGNCLIEVTNSNVNSLISQKSQVESELRNLNSMKTTEQNIITDLIGQREELKTQISEHENQIRLLQASSKEEELKLSDLKRELLEKQALLGKIIQEIASKQEEVKVLRGQISELTIQLANLNDQVQLQKTKLRDLQTQQANLSASIENLKIEKKDKENEVQRIKEEGRKKQQEQKQEAEAHRAVVKDLEKQKISLNGEVSARNGEVTALNVKVTQLKKQQTELTADVKGLEEQKSSLNSQIGTLNSSHQKLQAQMKSSQEAYAKQIEEQKGDHESRMKEFSRQIGKENEVHKTKKAENSRLDDLNQNLQQSITQLQQEIRSQKDHYETKSKEYTQLKLTRDSELHTINEQISQKQKKLLETENSLTSNTSKIEKQQKKLEEILSQIQLKKSESQGLETQLNLLREKKDASEREYDQQRNQESENLQKVKQELASESEQLEKSKAKRVTFEAQIETEKRLFQELQDKDRIEAEMKLAESKTQFTELNDQLAKKENALQKVKDKKISEQLALENIKKEAEEIKSQIKLLSKEKGEFLSTFEQQKRIKEGEIAALDNKILQLRTQQSGIETNLKTTQSLLDARQTIAADKQTQIGKLQIEVQALEGQKLELLTQIAGATDASAQQKLIRDLQEKVRELESKNIADLLNQKDEASNQLVQLQKMYDDKITNMQAQANQELKKVQEESSIQIDKLTNENTALVQENQQLKQSAQTPKDPQDLQAIIQKQGNSFCQPVPSQGDQQSELIDESVCHSSQECKQPLRQLSLSTCPLTNSQIIVEKQTPTEPNPVVEVYASQIEKMKSQHDAEKLKRDFMVEEKKQLEEENKQLQENIKGLKDEKSILQVEKGKIEVEVVSKKHELQRINEEIGCAKNTLQIFEENASQQKSKLIDENDQLTQQIKRNREELKDIATLTSKLEDTERQFGNVKAVLTEKQEQVKQLESKIELLQQEYNSSEPRQQQKQYPNDKHGEKRLQQPNFARQDSGKTQNQTSIIQERIGGINSSSRQEMGSQIANMSELTGKDSSQTPVNQGISTLDNPSVQNPLKTALDQSMMLMEKQIAKGTSENHNRMRYQANNGESKNIPQSSQFPHAPSKVPSYDQNQQQNKAIQSTSVQHDYPRRLELTCSDSQLESQIKHLWTQNINVLQIILSIYNLRTHKSYNANLKRPFLESVYKGTLEIPISDQYKVSIYLILKDQQGKLFEAPNLAIHQVAGRQPIEFKWGKTINL